MRNKEKNFLFDDYLLFALLVIANIILIWILPYLPTQDGPSHMYNLVILDDLVHGGKEWSDYYTLNLRLLPNLGFHVIAFPLLQIWSPIVTEKIFITLYALLLSSGYLYFLKSFEKPLFPLAYFILPIIFNFTLLMGNYSYTISIPIYIICLAFQWRFKDSNTIAKFITINTFGALLFLLHLIPFCLYIISTLLILALRYEKKFTTKYFLRQLLLILPILLILMVYLWNSSDLFQLSNIIENKDTASVSFKGILTRKFFLLCELFLFSTDNFSRWQLIPGSIFGFLVVCFGYESLKRLISKFFTREKVSPLNKYFLIQNIILIFLYIMAPFQWGSGSFFNERLPWVILLFLIPVLTIPDGLFKKNIRLIAIMIVALFISVNTIVFKQESQKVQDFMAGLKIEKLKGSFLMTYKNPILTWNRVDPLRHVASYYAIKNKCIDIGNYQAKTGFFLIEFNKKLPKFPPYYQIENKPESIDFSLYPFIKFILGYDLSDFDKENLKIHYEIIIENNDWSIWQRDHNQLLDFSNGRSI